MFGIVPFVRKAGQTLGIFDGKDGEDKLKKKVDDLGLKREGVDFHVGDNGKVRIKGRGLTQEQKEKLILAVGNVDGVGEVEDAVETRDDRAPAQFYTVKSGDTLSKIAKHFYGKPMKYTEIFEANKPMLTDPDKIYPGQVLRIPALDTKPSA